ncbi:MAG: hypothetical protein R3B70_19750 [Polyangiaceae bacterium]
MSARRDVAFLGAGKLAAEQQERALRRRLHDALVHGAGTVWGLTASACEPEHLRLRTRILVRPGLAVDPLGRDIYVDREQCLDVAGLARHPIWREMSPPPGAASPTMRRAYIIVRHDPPLCAPSPLSRGDLDPPQDRFRLELAAVPPADPETARRDHRTERLACAPPDVMANPFRALALAGTEDAIGPLASPDSESLPLLLATVDLELSGQGLSAVAYVAEPAPGAANPDNRVRLLLPEAKRVAEVLFGARSPATPPPRSRRGVVGAGH